MESQAECPFLIDERKKTVIKYSGKHFSLVIATCEVCSGVPF